MQSKNESPHSKDKKNPSTMLSIGPLILQSSQLEDSNFKDQFFVTRSSFQVNHRRIAYFIEYCCKQELIHKKLFILFYIDYMHPFNARIWKHNIQKN